MAEYLVNLTSGQIDEKGIYWPFFDLLNQSGVIQSGSMAVAAQGTPDMTVAVAGAATGHGIVFLTAAGDMYYGRNTANVNVTITSNSSGVTKTDAIVAYADLSAGSGTSNNPGALKFIAVRRSGSNTGAPITSEIETAVSNNPYLVLAHVSVSNGASSINSGNITDQRVRSGFGTDTVPTAAIQNLAVSKAKVAADAIDGTKVDWAATGLDGGIWWEEIGRTTLGTAGDTITVSSLPTRKYLKIIFWGIDSGSINSRLNFNNDSGSNYGNRFSQNNAADTAQNGQTAGVIASTTSAPRLVLMDVINVASSVKLVEVSSWEQATTGSNAPDRFNGLVSWNNTSSQITRVDITNLSTGSFAVGSEVIVLGHN